MGETQELLVLLYCQSLLDKDKEDMYSHHLEKVGFSQGEIAYLLERLEKKGYLTCGGFFSDYYSLTNKGEKVIKEAGRLVD